MIHKIKKGGIGAQVICGRKKPQWIALAWSIVDCPKCLAWRGKRKGKHNGEGA